MYHNKVFDIQYGVERLNGSITRALCGQLHSKRTEIQRGGVWGVFTGNINRIFYHIILIQRGDLLRKVQQSARDLEMVQLCWLPSC